ncbi:MAG: tyrosine-type recombinase/integrase [Acidimicrobiia bacterium]
MTRARVGRAVSITEEAREFRHVLAGVVLSGAALRLARLLDRGLLDESGWDPRLRVLFLPAQHRLLGRPVCRVDGCGRTVHSGLPDVCHRCFTRLTRLELTPAEIATAAEFPAAPAPADRCAVSGCRRQPTMRGAVLCEPHVRQFRQRRPRRSREEFLADGRVRPLPPFSECLVAACTRPADSACGYCNTHYQRWRVTQQRHPDLDPRWWQAREPGVPEPGQVNLRALPSLVVVEVLFGIQQRLRGGAKLTEVNLRAVCDLIRREQARSIEECEADRFPTKAARSLLRAFVRDVRRALADPGQEQAKDRWDLAIFGHRGTLSFRRIVQPWLAQTAKRWAAEQLPRHRGGGVARVQSKINSLGMLSEYLRHRPGHGLAPTMLGRSDIEGFLNRLAYLESTGRISRYHRNLVIRDVRAVLAGIRLLGLTRAGGPAAGLAGDFTIERGDIPADPERGEPGRDLPAEIMTVLCDHLDSLEPAEVKTAIQIGIDTGRRPEDILALALDCLTRDKDGGAVVVYDNAKADRLGRRLPISEATAEVIKSQQDQVRTRFPNTPARELKLLPTPRRNPDGRKPISISMLEGRHRHWVDTLPTLRTRDGVAFDKTRVVPYAYRHSYAQRHADAGVPIDVLAELLDHRSYTVTRRYYRIGEDRRRAAVDQVTALSFDRRGKRIWRDAQALLESEHARYAVGEVAVPFGVCAEPSNVKAGGNACPFRFRCVGCDHFRTDVSYLPDLHAYLDDLLRNRERLLAATDIDEWARAEATPSKDEISRVRRLITRIHHGLDDLTPDERSQVEQSVATVRRYRTVMLGLPRVRPPLPDLYPERTA